jgi:hypothetical protein
LSKSFHYSTCLSSIFSVEMWNNMENTEERQVEEW